MENIKINQKGWALAAVIFGISLIICAGIIRSTILEVKGYGRTVTVTGAAYKPITSDYAVWEANLQASALELSVASSKLNRDLGEVVKFMTANGFKEAEYQIGPVQISRSYDRDGNPGRYMLYQSLKMEMSDVARITEIARNASSLVQQGVELASFPPRYIFTGLEAVKLEMIQAATENAKLRAEQLAGATGRKVGAPISARVGVFQIRPLRSQEVSDYGMNDVTTVEKEIVCTVNINFMMD